MAVLDSSILSYSTFWLNNSYSITLWKYILNMYCVLLYYREIAEKFRLAESDSRLKTLMSLFYWFMNKEQSISLLFMLCADASCSVECVSGGVAGGDDAAERSSNVQPDKRSIKLTASATRRQRHQVLDDPLHRSASSGSWGVMQSNAPPPGPAHSRPKEVRAWPKTAHAHFVCTVARFVSKVGKAWGRSQGWGREGRDLLLVLLSLNRNQLDWPTLDMCTHGC